MGRRHIILIVCFTFLLAFLYVFGNRVPPPSSGNTVSNNSPDVPALHSEDILNEAVHHLPVNEKERYQTLSKELEKSNTPENCRDLAEFWEGQKKLNPAAIYYKRGALLENTENSLNFAGNLFLALTQHAESNSEIRWQAQEAVECFEKSLLLHPDNLDTKMALATCYTDFSGETMKGVMMLREIVAKDPDHLQANIKLGMLSVQSGQFDKAIERLEKVLYQKPENFEATFFLAEAYKGKRNIKRAKELFEKCKQYKKDPDFDQEMDSYLKTF